ncbi:MAG: nucleotidyltransferase family protein [Gammaproteobacteria bacterium]|nr:nucleotidyltransferase family protein [Gammaproteobacteria bacterium]
MKAMILAAGRGQRLRPLTDTLPKPLLEVRGKPLIVHHLEALRDSGFTEIVVNIAWLAETIQSYLGDGSRYGVSIRYSLESNGALETGGGIMNALPLLGTKPFLVVNADIYTDFPFHILSAGLQRGDLAHLVMVPNPRSHPKGDFFLSDDGRVHVDGPEPLTYSGIGVHDPQFFRWCTPGRFPMLPWWRKAIRLGLVSGQLYKGQWQDMGSLESFSALS